MDGGGVFQSRSGLESAVQVDTCPLFMLELQQKGKTAGPETATQQERRLSLIGLQDIPVEGFAGTAISGAGSIEKKVTCNPPVVMRAFAITFFSILPAPDMAVPANPSTGISCKPIGERRLSYRRVLFRSSAGCYVGICDYFLFDTACSGYGGSGKTFNWNILQAYQGKTDRKSVV